GRGGGGGGAGGGGGRVGGGGGHGRERGITHEYRGRVFESRFLPKALLIFIVADELAAEVAATVADAARSGNESGDGLVWTTPVAQVTHHRTGLPLDQAA